MRVTVNVEGQYFPPLSSRSIPAKMKLSESGHHILFQDGSCRDDIIVEGHHGLDMIQFTDGSAFRSLRPLPPEALDHLHSPIERKLSWLETAIRPKTLALVALLVAMLVLMRLGLVNLTGFLVNITPPSWEASLGAGYYDGMKGTILGPSKIDPELQEDFRQVTSQMAVQSGFDPLPDLYFHSSEKLGANAIALPGGPVIVTDDLIDLLSSKDEVLAVIAHELGHIKNRHALRQTYDLLGMSLLASFIFGTDDSLIEEITVIGLSGWSSYNSRDFERDADMMAITILEASGRNPNSYFSAMKKLAAHECSPQEDMETFDQCMANRRSGWLSTHPTGAERLDNLRDRLEQAD